MNTVNGMLGFVQEINNFIHNSTAQPNRVALQGAAGWQQNLYETEDIAANNSTNWGLVIGLTVGGAASLILCGMGIGCCLAYKYIIKPSAKPDFVEPLQKRTESAPGVEASISASDTLTINTWEESENAPSEATPLTGTYERISGEGCS
jgi:hypothetical protein